MKMNKYELVDCYNKETVCGYIITTKTAKQIQDLINPVKNDMDLEELKNFLYENLVGFQDTSTIDGEVIF